MSKAPASTASRVRLFFTERIWDERPVDLPLAQAALYRVCRLAYSTVRGFFVHDLPVRAAALTYFTALSVVPFLAFAFAILKGFGAYRTLIEGTVQPYLAETFSPNPALHQAITRILGIVDATDFSKIGAVGLLLLLYTSVTLISNVEGALNFIFGAKTTRPVLRQLTDYVTLLVTTPLLVLAGGTASTAAQSSTVVRLFRERLGLGPMIDFAFGLAPLLAVGLALFAMYLILPNVHTRWLSALVGAAVAAVGWQLVLVLHVQLQMGVARASAMYSVLGAIPIFLVWTFVSWLVVLVGAELAASHQNEHVERERLHGRPADQALREMLAVALGARVARDFLHGAPRPTAPRLAASLEIPPPLVGDILDRLVRAGLLVRTAASELEVGYVPGRDLDDVHASDLADALRRDPAADDVRASVERQLGPDLRGVLVAAELERRRSRHDLTLRELAALAPGGEHGAAAGDVGEPRAVDEKQPDLPS